MSIVELNDIDGTVLTAFFSVFALLVFFAFGAAFATPRFFSVALDVVALADLVVAFAFDSVFLALGLSAFAFTAFAFEAGFSAVFLAAGLVAGVFCRDCELEWP